MKPAPRPNDGVVRGFLQLCSDLRFHRATMAAFEEATGLAEDGYWIEARPGGAPRKVEVGSGTAAGRAEGTGTPGGFGGC